MPCRAATATFGDNLSAKSAQRIKNTVVMSWTATFQGLWERGRKYESLIFPKLRGGSLLHHALNMGFTRAALGLVT